MSRTIDFSDGFTSASPSTSGTLPASDVSNTPSGNLAATNVQSALNELQTDIDTRTTASSTTTFTNKTFDADGSGNSITNIENADIKVGAAIDATKIANGLVSNTEFQYLDGVTSGIQGQIDLKAPIASPTFTGTATVANIIDSGLTANTVPYANGSKQLTSSSVTPTELGYVSGVTSGIQTQLDAKIAKATFTTKGDIPITTGASTVTRYPISGNDGWVLTEDSASSGGIKWAAATAAPSTSYEISNLGLATSVASNALTIRLKQADGSTDPGAGASAVKVGMPSSTLTSGLYNQRSATAATSLVISSGSTLGQTSGRASRIYIYLIDNAGTLELAVSHRLYSESLKIFSTTAEGGAGAADSAGTVYSTTSRSNVPFRLIGFLDNTQTTAGTWASAGTKLHVGDLASLTAETPKLAVSGSTTTAAGAATTVSWLTTETDTHGTFASNEYTIPVSGHYFIDANMRHSGSGTVNQYSLAYIQVDTVTKRQSFKYVESTGVAVWSHHVTYLADLSAGQKVRLQHETNIGSPNIGTNGTDVCMHIFMIK